MIKGWQRVNGGETRKFRIKATVVPMVWEE